MLRTALLSFLISIIFLFAASASPQEATEAPTIPAEEATASAVVETAEAPEAADPESTTQASAPETEDDPFADMIGMSEKELRKKFGKPHQKVKTAFGDESYQYHLKNGAILVFIIRDKKVFKAAAYARN